MWTPALSFPLEVTVHRESERSGPTTGLKFTFAGRARSSCTQRSTGRTASLSSPSLFPLDTTTGSVGFRGHRVWSWSSGKRSLVDGRGSLDPPGYLLSAAHTHARVIDPCALVAASPPSTKPVTTPAPWALPAYALSQIGSAGLIPLVGNLVRHDHVHLDVIVNGRKITVPAGVGLAEPVDRGPCRPPVGDCATGHCFTAEVANSPLHTHGASGLIHVEPDAHGDALGELRRMGLASALAIGSYCTGGGKELRVFVDGRPVSGDPRKIILTNHQEIAVVYGGPDDFGSVPASYKGVWPGLGCGGPNEVKC
jgi:hypothetical protein